jgi:large subunit ribosomal protein L18
MQALIDRKLVHRRIRHRVRRKVTGTPERPRLAVFRSRKHIYVQAIDDTQGRTLAQCSTLDPELKPRLEQSGNVASAKVVGEAIASRLKQAGVGMAVFDRGGFAYHGRIKALAEAARSGGLDF